MVSFILHMRSARRVSLSLSLSLASTSLSPGKETTFSSLLAPGLASGRWRPRGGEPRARRSAFVVEGRRHPRDSSTHLPWLLSPLELRSTSSCSSRCAPRPLSLPTPNPLGFSARANKGNLHGDPENKWPAAASRKCFHQSFHHNISMKKTTFPGKMSARN